MKQFSIVIPVYRTEEYLDQCVESVLTQTFREFEIILVDDGSPDRCGELCDRWAERDDRVKVVHRENGGLSAARNTGIRNASGEYVLFLDSDDWWAENTVLEAIRANLEKTDADVVSFNYRKSYNGVLEAPYFPAETPSAGMAWDLRKMMDGNLWVTGACNKAVRRDVLNRNSLYFREGITAEDIDWTLRLALCCETFSFENVCVFVYRQIASSISHRLSPQKVECLCDNIRECTRLLEQAGGETARRMYPFVAYQYGTLLHNVANTPSCRRSKKMLEGVEDMKWLLDYAANPKTSLLRICTRITGIHGTMMMLRIRQLMLNATGKGV